MGLEEPGPGSSVDHLRFSVSDHFVGIDASELMPEPLGPRNRDHARASALLLAALDSEGVFAVGGVSGSELRATRVTDSGRVPAPFWRARGPRPGPSKPVVSRPMPRSTTGRRPRSQNLFRRLLLRLGVSGASCASGIGELMMLDSWVCRRGKRNQPAWAYKVSVSTHKSR